MITIVHYCNSHKLYTSDRPKKKKKKIGSMLLFQLKVFVCEPEEPVDQFTWRTSLKNPRTSFTR